MNVLIYALLAIVGVGAVGFALVPALLGIPARADKRIKALQGDIQANRRDADAARTRDDAPQADPGDAASQQNEALGKRQAPRAAAGPDLSRRA